jgi:hypothetical protein
MGRGSFRNSPVIPAARRRRVQRVGQPVQGQVEPAVEADQPGQECGPGRLQPGPAKGLERTAPGPLRAG